MRRTLWWLLPILHVGLGVILGFWGKSQTGLQNAGRHIIDYVAPSEFILHLINMPVAILVSTIAGKGNFEIGLEYSAKWFVVYLILIALFWSLIGLQFSRAEASSQIPSNAKKTERLLGTVFGLLVLLMGILLIHNPLGYLVSLGAFAWGVSLIVMFRRNTASVKAA